MSSVLCPYELRQFCIASTIVVYVVNFMRFHNRLTKRSRDRLLNFKNVFRISPHESIEPHFTPFRLTVHKNTWSVDYVSPTQTSCACMCRCIDCTSSPIGRWPWWKYQYQCTSSVYYLRQNKNWQPNQFAAIDIPVIRVCFSEGIITRVPSSEKSF